MQILVIAVGKLKERYWRDAVAEYAKRLSGYVRIDIQEVADEAAPEQASDATVAQIKSIEAARIEKHLRDRDGLVILDRQGKAVSSEGWSQTFTDLTGRGFGRLVFVLGGSLGVDQSLLRRADWVWSFGPLTLPHQLARVVLLEQLYRGIRIARGEPYHK